MKAPKRCISSRSLLCIAGRGQASTGGNAHLALAVRARRSLIHGERVDDLFPQGACRRVRLLRHVEYRLREPWHHRAMGANHASDTA